MDNDCCKSYHRFVLQLLLLLRRLPPLLLLLLLLLLLQLLLLLLTATATATPTPTPTATPTPTYLTLAPSSATSSSYFQASCCLYEGNAAPSHSGQSALFMSTAWLRHDWGETVTAAPAFGGANTPPDAAILGRVHWDLGCPTLLKSPFRPPWFIPSRAVAIQAVCQVILRGACVDRISGSLTL